MVPKLHGYDNPRFSEQMYAMNVSRNDDKNVMDDQILLETMDGFDEDAYLERMNRQGI